MRVEFLNRFTIMDYSVITPKDVLESLMNDGTINAIRLKIINQLEANVSGLGFST